jgi:hypothetical protein
VGDGGIVPDPGVEGLGANGCVTINSDELNNNANGTIYFGSTSHTPPLDDVTFDGGVRVFDDSGDGSDGDITGYVIVTGCHATTADLDVCPDGAITGSVIINQSGCTNTVTNLAVCGCP